MAIMAANRFGCTADSVRRCYSTTVLFMQKEVSIHFLIHVFKYDIMGPCIVVEDFLS